MVSVLGIGLHSKNNTVTIWLAMGYCTKHIQKPITTSALTNEQHSDSSRGINSSFV